MGLFLQRAAIQPKMEIRHFIGRSRDCHQTSPDDAGEPAVYPNWQKIKNKSRRNQNAVCRLGDADPASLASALGNFRGFPAQ
jgi:hypothetical protein